jgi:hypothetical protein
VDPTGTIIAPDPERLPTSKKDAVIAPPMDGIAFSTLDTKKLSNVSKSPKLAAVLNTTVAPFVAVKLVIPNLTPLR